jgi:putative spermidine/putrescine transport system substrate-binding protein
MTRQPGKISRRQSLAGVAAAGVFSALGRPAAARAPAVPRGTVLTISLWGGITEDSIRRLVQPEFERLTGATLAYDIGGQGMRLNKLLAQRGHPPADVIFTTDEGVITGHKAGVLIGARKKNMPNLADVFEWTQTVKAYGTDDTVPGVPYTVISSVIAFNPDKVKTPPTSWNDLWLPEARGKLAIAGPAGSTAPELVIIGAELAGGSAAKPDAGFTKLGELRPAKLAIFWTDYAPMVKTGEIIMSTELDYYVEAMKSQGYPYDYVYPKEKAIGLSEYASIVKGTAYPELAEAFLDLMLDPKIQEALSRETFQGTVNSKVKLSPAVAARCACGDRTQQLRFFDPAFIASVRPAWTERLTTDVLPQWGLG